MTINLAKLFPVGSEWSKRESANILAELDRAKVKKPMLANIGLPAIDPRDWQDKDVPERQWFVDGWIPDRTVTNLSGDGGSGKTEIILQLLAASSLQTPWFGKDVSAGPCLYYGAEDEADIMARKMKPTNCTGVWKRL
jgi:RecA-family ATPase